MDNDIKERFDKIDAKLDTFENRLFQDNGGECFQSKINRHNGQIKAINKRLAIVGGAMLTTIIGLVIWVGRTIISRIFT